MLLALALSGVAARAQEKDKEPIPPPVPAGAPSAAQAIIVPIGGVQRLSMTTKKRIARAINPNEVVVRISPIQDRPNEVLINGLEPGIVRITLVDVDGKEETYEIIVQLDVEYLRSLLQRGVPKANIQIIPAANNTIILQGNVEHAEDIDAILRIAQSVVLSPDRIINRLRVGGVVQVQLDVAVARVSRSEFRRMAFAFQEGGFRTFVASTVGVANMVTAAQAVSPAASSGLLSGAPGNLFLGVINNQNSFFGFLQALREENIVKLMAEPKLVTLSGRPASFLSGGEQAIPVPAGLGQIGVQFEEFGTRLNFLPIVLGDGRIHLEVEPEVSFLDPAAGVNIQGTTVPGRATQRVHTTVELETGQTFIIGGLIQRTIRGSTVKVPILGDIPFLGTAFSRKNYEETEEELVVMVTPYLVDALACNQVPKLLPGQETRSPDDFELFLEGILEAPRGRRYAFQDCRYVAAHQEGPTANLFPCYDCLGNGGNGGCGACGKDLHPMAAPGGRPPAGVTPHATFPGAGRDDKRPGGAGAPAALPDLSGSPVGSYRLP
jgi:pilus assembly protein CpaC